MSSEQEFQLAGSWPRSFALQGAVMVVADQRGPSLQLLRHPDNHLTFVPSWQWAVCPLW